MRVQGLPVPCQRECLLRFDDMRRKRVDYQLRNPCACAATNIPSSILYIDYSIYIINFDALYYAYSVIYLTEMPVMH